MKLRLNKNQIEFMLNHYFEDEYEIYKCFDTCNRTWIKEQKIELVEDKYGWHDVLVNGEKMTSINTKHYMTDFRRMLEIK